MNWSMISEILISAVRMATPLLFVALAELYSERAGLVNIGLDGIMAFGSLVGFLVCYWTGNPFLGVLCGALGGVLVNMVYAFCTITLAGQQIVYGMALNIFAPALASFIYRIVFGVSSTLAQATLMKTVSIPVLKDIPFFGKLLFDQTPMVYAVYLLVIVTMIYFNRTKSGLNFKAVGEYPKAAETMGINVIRTKYLAAIICGFLAGMGARTSPPAMSTRIRTASSRAADSSRWQRSSSVAGPAPAYCSRVCSSASLTPCSFVFRSAPTCYPISSSR